MINIERLCSLLYRGSCITINTSRGSFPQSLTSHARLWVSDVWLTTVKEIYSSLITVVLFSFTNWEWLTGCSANKDYWNFIWELIYQACHSAIWQDPPAWAPVWLHAARPTTGHTGTHQPDWDPLEQPAGTGDSVTGHRISRQTKPERERERGV